MQSINSNSLNSNLNETKANLIAELDKRVTDHILEQTNADLLKKLITNADSIPEAQAIAELGTTYKRTGLHFDKRLEKITNDIKYLKKNEKLSFINDTNALTHKLIIGDNYDALLNLLVSHKNSIDVIYIDPPYGIDKLGDFAKTNYNNAITRDNLLSMLYPRLQLAKMLLSDDGVIFCSIDDKNHAYVKCLFDEVFGEESFLFDIPRITKKGGKSTNTIQKNHDYVIAYTRNQEIIFSQLEKDCSKYVLKDEYVEERGCYCLSQPLDYNSLQYSENMDFEIEFDGKKYIPGGDYEKFKERHNGNHGVTDWVWRWSKSAIEWGIQNGMIVVNSTGRIYSKTYLNVRKVNGKNELEKVDPKKSYSTLSFLENENSNDNGKKNLDMIFNSASTLFKNPKPVVLIKNLLKMINFDKNICVLDFFAGSGTTGQAVLDLNRDDGGNRQFILVTNNEKTDMNPNGIAYDVTSKRLKRVMCGECYDGTKDFDWLKKNEPYGNNLEVTEIAKVPQNEIEENKTPFDVIDETLYGQEKLELKDKIDWVCKNFSLTTRTLGE